MTLIVFVGSVFSPYYAWARKRGGANPLNHCAVNVALYGPRGNCWAMTERPRASVKRFSQALKIGPSMLSWDGNMLRVEVDELTAPFPSRIRGEIRLYPTCLSSEEISLDPEGLHQWCPIAPCSHVEVDLEQPGIRWSGPGYLDANMGSGPLEDSFAGWSWSRAKIHRDTAVIYDVGPRKGETLSIAMRFNPAGRIEPFTPPPRYRLQATGWRVRRDTRADQGSDTKVRRTLEDGPFYARSLLSTRLLGENVTAIHESLSLDRFKSGVVKAMLPFRMPRWPL